MGHSQNTSKREMHNNAGLPKITKTISNKQSNSHLKELEKEENTKPKVCRRKVIIKIKAKINKI